MQGRREIHNIYLRCYRLPRYGRDARVARDREWMAQRLRRCREYLALHAG